MAWPRTCGAAAPATGFLAAEVAGPRGRRVARLTGVVAGAVGVAASGAAAIPPLYMLTPVSWTAPGSSAMSCTVTWCPAVSVSRTVNGPLPAPEAAIQ